MPFTIQNNPEAPLISVAMVTYNSSSYVKVAIDSVLASSYTNFELIISDDCSTDNTWEIIKTYNDIRIQATRNKINIGEYPNRNKCINLAKGEYFIFIDGDDVIYQYGLEIYMRQALMFDKPNLIIQKGYINNIIFPILIKSEEIFQFELSNQGILSSSFSSNFFKTSVLINMGGLNETLISSDNEIRYKIASKFPVLFISGWLTWPRETPNQASKKLLDGIGLVESFITFINLFTILPIEHNIKNKKINSFKRLILKTIIKHILKLKFRKAKLLYIKSGLTMTQILASIYKRRFTPINLPYSPQFPISIKSKNE